MHARQTAYPPHHRCNHYIRQILAHERFEPKSMMENTQPQVARTVLILSRAFSDPNDPGSTPLEKLPAIDGLGASWWELTANPSKRHGIR